MKKIFELCITESENGYSWNTEKMTVINDGDYQGMEIFIIPTSAYQPGADDYIMTNNYYGSCSACDTLLSICEYNSGIPNEEQVNEYMTLCLHLVQKIRKLPLANEIW